MMVKTFVTPEVPRPLAEVLARRPKWSAGHCLRLIHRLALHVQSLHEQGRLHRAIGVETVTVDEQLRPTLDPPVGPRCFGGDDHADPEFCPPVLGQGDPIELPEALETLGKVLQENGHSLDPRSIDVYQLGVLLCRLATGQSIRCYMLDPTVKAEVPDTIQAVLDRALGHDAAGRIDDCGQLIEALDEAASRLDSTEEPFSLHETPAHGSMIGVNADTPPKGLSPASKSSGDELPFERLGHFQIVEKIGYGGMGDVYRGYDESLDRHVAVKVLPAELARDEDFVRRFHAEATAAAKVAHPNVVPVYFIGQDAGHHFFAMQYIEGESLADRLKRRGRLPLDETLEVLVECLAGLKAAHDHGLIHRDIKPGNILLERRTSRAMLVDFGLVRRMGESTNMTATGVVMGTVDYIAPEQARGQKVDGRADLYSMGVLAYQLLAGRLPFEAETPTAMIFQHAYEDPKPLTELAPDVPQPIVYVIARMMAKAPDDRYRSCHELLADLEAYRRGESIEIVEPSPEKPSPTLLASELSAVPELPANLDRLADDRPLRRARDLAATMFRRHAPEFVKELQNTTQQVDGAVAEYERRHARLSKLHAEACEIANELAEQLGANKKALAEFDKLADSATDAHERHAALDKQAECEEQVAVLQDQLVQQQQQVEETEHHLTKADATLARLRSQRDLLKARLRTADARQKMDIGRPRAKRRRLVLAVVVSCVILLSWAVLWFSPGQPELAAPRPNIVPVPSLEPQPVSAAGSSSIRGMVFEDRNGDGVRDLGERGLPGWTIQVQRVEGDGELLQTFVNPSPAALDKFGQFVTAVGSNVLVTAVDDDTVGSNAGAAYLFHGVTGQLLQTFLNPTPHADDFFGHSAAVVGDQLLISDHMDDAPGQDAGTVHLFDVATGEYVRTIANPDPARGTGFGVSVASSGEQALIGLATVQDGGAMAYLYNGMSGELIRTYDKPKSRPEAWQNRSVSMVGKHVLVGAPDETPRRAAGAGAAYLFDGSTGEIRHRLVTLKARSNDKFGHCVAAVGRNILVGAYLDDRAAVDSGAVYLFDGETGELLRTFLDPERHPTDQFGYAVAGVGDDVLVGAFADDTGGQDSGTVYLFDGKTGNLLHTYHNPEPNPADWFGASVAATEDKVLVGAMYDDTGGADVGAAYLFGRVRGDTPITVTTNPEGFYEFTQQGPGKYLVWAVKRDGYALTGSRRGRAREVIVTSGEAISGPQFGVYQLEESWNDDKDR